MPITEVALPSTGELVLVIGPEGGIAPDELAQFTSGRRAGGPARSGGAPDVDRGGRRARRPSGALTNRWSPGDGHRSSDRGPAQRASRQWPVTDAQDGADRVSVVQEYRYGSHPSQFVRLHLPVGCAPVGRRHPARRVLAGQVRHRTRRAAGRGPRQVRRRIGGGRVPPGRATAAAGRRRWPTSPGPSIIWPPPGSTWPRGGWPLDRVAAVGHSAGGQLAAWLAHRRSLRSGTAGSVTPGHAVRAGHRRGVAGRRARSGRRVERARWATARSTT